MLTLRGYWPFPTQQSTNGSTGTESLIKGCYLPQHPGPFHHRMERLVQIELADLVVHRQYLDPHFTDLYNSPSFVSFPHSTTEKQHLHRVKCSDCTFPLFGAAGSFAHSAIGSRIHREIFPLTRIREGKNKNGEWEYVVKPVIQRWGESDLFKLNLLVADYYCNREICAKLCCCLRRYRVVVLYVPHSVDSPPASKASRLRVPHHHP
jgi:hypothetical protein